MEPLLTGRLGTDPTGLLRGLGVCLVGIYRLPRRLSGIVGSDCLGVQYTCLRPFRSGILQTPLLGRCLSFPGLFVERRPLSTGAASRGPDREGVPQPLLPCGGRVTIQLGGLLREGKGGQGKSDRTKRCQRNTSRNTKKIPWRTLSRTLWAPLLTDALSKHFSPNQNSQNFIVP